MPLSTPVEALVHHLTGKPPSQTDETEAVLSAFAASDERWVKVGRWEVGPFGESDARGQLEACGASQVLEKYDSVRGIGNDAGAHTAVVAWNAGEPEVVFVLDPEYQKAEPAGTLAVWLAALTVPEQPEGLVADLNPLGWQAADREDDLFAEFRPGPEIAAKLEGKGHLAFANPQGVPVAIHKKGVRSWIDGKAKAKSTLGSTVVQSDWAGSYVWTASFDQVARLSVPDLSVATAKCPGDRIVAFSDGSAAAKSNDFLQLLTVENAEVVLKSRYHTGFGRAVFLVQSHGRWIGLREHGKPGTLLAEWDGGTLRVRGAVRATVDRIAESGDDVFLRLWDGAYHIVRLTGLA